MVENLPGTAIQSNHLTGNKSLFSSQNYKMGQPLTSFSYTTVHSIPSRYTIQIDEDQHIELLPVLLRYIDHSCDPNMFFDTRLMKVICLKDISEGEAFNYFYPSTEWIMKEPFNCMCGSENCINIIQGAFYLPEYILNKYSLSEFILKKLHLLQRK